MSQKLQPRKPNDPNQSVALVALGSSTGDRHRFIDEALGQISISIGPIISTSHIIETLPIGGVARNRFLNGAAKIGFSGSVHDLMTALLLIETKLGRTRTAKWQDRTIDLDILLANDAGGRPYVIDSAELIVPHREMLRREFVLIPAAEIAGDWIHPVTGRRLDEELESCRAEARR